MWFQAYSHIIRISLCQSLTLVHQKGGVGKSLLSYHLAYLLKDNYDVQLLDLDNQKSLSSIHKLRNHKLQQHSIPIKTVHSKHELIDLINSIDDNQYLIID